MTPLWVVADVVPLTFAGARLTKTLYLPGRPGSKMTDMRHRPRGLLFSTMPLVPLDSLLVETSPTFVSHREGKGDL